MSKKHILQFIWLGKHSIWHLRNEILRSSNISHDNIVSRLPIGSVWVIDDATYHFEKEDNIHIVALGSPVLLLRCWHLSQCIRWNKKSSLVIKWILWPPFVCIPDIQRIQPFKFTTCTFSHFIMNRLLNWRTVGWFHLLVWTQQRRMILLNSLSTRSHCSCQWRFWFQRNRIKFLK